MREGPLAALFRSTEKREEEQGKEEVARRPASASGPAAPPAPPQEEPTVPSPQERLRHAFSSDIPKNVLWPTTPAARDRPRPEPAAAPAATPAATGSPVLRVVGIGGHRLHPANRMGQAEVEGVQVVGL